ncbi:UCH-domain-containing protein [Xylariaceae sp. AK1471]|nr:UCH-domain-containing protein [Xylariaceae sp. AK1471]
MGGASEFPERASSPLKRRASSMEPESAIQAQVQVQDADEDVDMVTAPLSNATGMATSRTNEFSEPIDTQTSATDESMATTIDAVPGPSTSHFVSSQSQPTPATALQPPASIEAHTNAIRACVEEFNKTPLVDGQECYIVSKYWLSGVFGDSPKKQVTTDLSTILPVDNSDIIEEVIDDPCVGNGVVDIMKRRFVRLKHGYGIDHFIAFPTAAWELLMQWPGLKEGQIPIRRTATDNSERQDGSNVQIEFHPLVLTVHRLWSANSQVPVDASLKASNPPPPRLARSSNMKFQAFLKQAKAMVKIDLTQRVRGWQILNAPEPYAVGAAVPTPPKSSEQFQSATHSPAVWDHLLVDVEAFTKLERGAERLMVEFADLTNDPNQKSNKKTESYQTLRSLGIAKDQPIILDPHEEGTQWTSNYILADTTTLPTRNNSATLTVQNHAPRGGRASPIPTGPTTRGRSTKSGRALGCVGLTNLGNTCYMNAALQCVRSVEELTKYFLVGEWEKELNKANILAHNGEVAASYAQLLKDIYKDSAPGAVTPRQFKSTIGRHAPQFQGYGQQDSQEFLGFLLDGLQEDLSRVKKKPYIEKPDSTDEMVGDPEAIRKMADEVWDITRKRDDSVIADLFTGLYKSTLVCPVCDKVSITFDPFNNLTLQLPIANKWNHTVKFFPLNDKPIDIRVEVDKHDSIKALKQFVSSRTGVPVERLHGCEEWSKKFYKHYLDTQTASEEITNRDNAWIFELEAKPSNYPGTAPKQQQKYRSMLDDNPPVSPSVSWDDEQAASLLVPVIHRKPGPGKGYQSRKWEAACIPHFIVVTPQEARSEDIIRRKVLEKVATFTKHNLFAQSDESDGSETTEPEMIGPNGSDTASSVGGKVIDQSVKGEDDIVDVQMKDASDANNVGKYARASLLLCEEMLTARRSRSPQPQFNRKRPAWIGPKTFLPPQFQNLFEMGICTETSSPIPTGSHSVSDDRDYPKLSSRVPAESFSSEDQFDNATNGTASNDESSSDEASRRSTEMPPTRMNEESDDEGNGPAVKSFTHRPKPGHPAKANTKLPGGRKKMKPGRQYGGKSKKRLRQQRQQEKRNAIDFEDPADLSDPVPDGGPLIRLREGLVVDWSQTAYDEIFSTDGTLETWETCDTLPDPVLEKAQEARAKRRKHGLTLDECLDEFERDEILSDQDMWYCPRCKEHRRASKKLDLWKTPDILIIHLKRFSSSGFRRDKLETLVEFPTEDLDITSRVLQKEDGKQEIYDLIGVDCHYGGLGGGHYTAYAKNFIDGQWYSYNDSMVSKTSTERIVDSSAYMLFYRRRSDVPLGGRNLHRILERYGDDDDMSGLGEGRRLGEGFSQNGSSSALQGVGVSHLPENRGGNSNTALTQHNTTSFEADDKGDDDIPLLASSRFQSGQDIEDEAIELEDTGPSVQPFTGLGTWSFENIPNAVENSPFDSGAASDEAQHDSSGDERALSSQGDMASSLPGMSEYRLPQPGVDPPSYLDHSATDFLERPLSSGTNRMRNVTHEIHEVDPNGEQEPLSDDAAEIHLDDNDKIKVQ